MSGEHLRALADQVEALTGADRELDGSIWWACLTSDEVEHFDRTGYVRQCIERDGSAGKALNQFYDSRNKACLANIAFAYPYTSSVDAALSLIPAAEMRLLDIELGFEPPHAEVWPAASVRWYPAHKEGNEWHAMVVTAATLPLTITAAALRARAANADEVSA